MTTIVSVFGIAGRFAGDLLGTALGWASSLIFGRVPKSHQRFLLLMLAGSLLWMLAVVGLLLPSLASLTLSATPHPPFVNAVWLAFVLIIGVIVLPLGVGLAGYLVPADGERPTGLGIIREITRGYLLAPLISGLLVFLAAVGLVRKIRSARHGWSDTHVPIVVKPGGYDEMTNDLRDALDAADLPVSIHDAPWVLTVPARLLTSVAGSNVRKLRPDRLVELKAPGLRIGLYPSDIAISCVKERRTRARAAVVSRLATTAAHMTTSAEGQGVEDRLERLANGNGYEKGMTPAAARYAFDGIDAKLLDLAVTSDEWDILYRLRLQIERDLLARTAHGAVTTAYVPAVMAAPASAPSESQSPTDQRNLSLRDYAMEGVRE